MERSRHGSTAGQVRKAIRADIQTGVFPAGSRLTSEMLAERYRVSRTPVREALIRLEEDGLVCGTPNAGYELRQPTIAELCEIYELREALEGLAIERTIRTGVPPELLKELRQACELRRNSSVNGELEAGDFAFHRAICRHCGSAALRGIIDNTLLLSTGKLPWQGFIFCCKSHHGKHLRYSAADRFGTCANDTLCKSNIFIYVPVSQQTEILKYNTDVPAEFRNLFSL